MAKFLSIVIPRYTETEKDVFPLLSSINGQLGINLSNLEVIVVNDGGGIGPLDENFLSLFDYEIKQINMEENKGPGVARQVGMEAATAEYVMFCDADDTLHSVGVLGALIQEAENNVPDIVTSEWLEECARPDGNGYIYITHQIENTWMHGKLLRRKFVMNNNIKFHDKLRVHEDTYFLSIAAALSQRTTHIPVTTYVWKHRFSSITRRNNGIYSFESIPTFIEACCLSHQDVEKSHPEQMEYKVDQFVLYIYFTLQRPEWRTEDHLQYVEASEKMFAKMMVPFWKYWKNTPQNKLVEYYTQERVRTFNGGIELETIDSWTKRMMESVDD